MLRKIFFYLQYLFFDPPWDTGISPPELMSFIEGRKPGRALDLGCGTGTNAITLAEHGWDVVGVDYVSWAIRTARKKAREAGVRGKITFHMGDILDLDPDQGPFDLVLDIGCFHSFAGGEVVGYAELVHDLIAPGGYLLLYTHLRGDPASGKGASEGDFKVLERGLDLVHREDGTEGETRRSAWLIYQKVPEGGVEGAD